MRKVLRGLLMAVLALGTVPAPMMAQQATAYAGQARFGSFFPALNYGKWVARASAGSFSAGTYSITIQGPGFVTSPTGTPFIPFNVNAPLLVGIGAAQETVTPTAVSGCALVAAPQAVCTITATYANAHGPGTQISSASVGVQEAINVAWGNGGGQVTIDQAWYSAGGTTTILQAAVPYWNVSIIDQSNGVTRNWNPTPTGAALAVPTTLTSQAACDATHQFCSDATVAGSASWGGTVFGAVAYMDCFGNEGPPSLTASFTSVASKAIDIASPAASTGACGWVPYLSLSGGTYAQAYQIPPTSSVCTLSVLTPVPSCAITNTTYGTTASIFGAGGLFTKGGAQITGFPVNTGQHFTQLASTVQTTVSWTPVSNSSVSYSYAPSNRVGACGSSSANVAKYAASASSTTGIPMAVATWTIPAGCFNYIGAEFRVSGKFTYTDGGAANTQVVHVSWDAAGTNTTTVPTDMCVIQTAATVVGAAQNVTYSCSVRVATTGASGTVLANGFMNRSLAAGQTTLVGTGLDTGVAPSAAINLTAPARITVQFTNTGSTSNPGAQGLAASLEVLN